MADITKGLKAVLEMLRAKAPDATIIATAIFPRNDNMAVMPAIDQINRNLSKLADGQKIRYLNINQKLADRDGRLFDGMMNNDKLHPAIPGYQVWADALKPLFYGFARSAGKARLRPSAHRRSERAAINKGHLECSRRLRTLSTGLMTAIMLHTLAPVLH